VTLITSQTFGQIKKLPKVAMVRFGDSSNYDVNPTGKYDLIITALNRFLIVDSLIKNQENIIVCLDRYDIFDEEVKEVLNPLRLPSKIGAYNITYLNRKNIVTQSEVTKKPIRFALIREIIDYHYAARISLTSKLQLPKQVKNFSDKEFFVLYEYLFKNSEYQFQPEESQSGWQLISR
jgi:hypothetical protein